MAEAFSNKLLDSHITGEEYSSALSISSVNQCKQHGHTDLDQRQELYPF